MEDHPTHQQAYHVLAALAAARPADDKVVEIALKWVQDNSTHQQGYELLKALVAARPADDKVVGIALKWVEDRPIHEQAYELLRALVAARPTDDKVVKIALKWEQDNPTHQRGYVLLQALVAARPADDKVVEIALKWVEDNSMHRQGYELLRALVAARPTDDKVVGVARTWLNNNPNHPQAYNLLSTLIRRAGGFEEWMQKGKEALLNATEAGKRTLLVALLAASKAQRHYIELMLDAISAELDMRNKTFLKGSLGRALANNVQNSLQFLAGQSTDEYKRIAAQALARGLQKDPNRAQEFLELSHAAPTGYIGFLLAACIASAVPGEFLNSVLRRWLNDHQYLPGYRTVLAALKEHPTRWNELLELGGLNPGVQINYRNL
jgi:hypothetical protein